MIDASAPRMVPDSGPTVPTIELRLSPGERDVLLDVGVGLTDCAIATRHGMSRRGIQNRLASIYRKLGVHRSTRGPEELAIAPRSRAVFLALEHGLIEPSELSHRAREHGSAAEERR